MKLRELLASTGVDLQEVAYFRHSLNDDVIAENRKIDKEAIARGYQSECLDFYQRVQSKNLLDGYKYLLAFLSADGTNAVLYGCFSISGYQDMDENLLPSNFYIGNMNFSEAVLWNLERTSTIGTTELLLNMEGRLVIDWGKDPVNWFKPALRKNALNIEVMYIEPPISEYEFQGFDKVVLSFEQLSNIVKNKESHSIWEKELSSHSGIYLITDVKTGKLYVGSAYSESGGLWGRWSNYVNTRHGGNKLLKRLIDNEVNYCHNFQFSILDVFPIKRDKHEILQYEQLYKKKLRSIEHGLNDN